MPPTYSAKGTAIKPYQLTHGELAAIGRVIRACAEIEDIINLYIYKLADIPEGTGMLLLGRMAVTNRVKLLGLFAQARGDNSKRLFREAFDNADFRDLLKMRNTLAHGYLLGLTESDEVAFQVQETQGIEGAKVYTTVNAYSHTSFDEIARVAEDIIPQMEKAFGLTSLRQKRKSPLLSPHTKAKPKRPPRAKP